MLIAQNITEIIYKKIPNVLYCMSYLFVNTRLNKGVAGPKSFEADKVLKKNILTNAVAGVINEVYMTFAKITQ